MPNTPNTQIPYVPEGTLDPAAGLNDSLNVIDALLQPRVVSMALYEPPATGEDGDMYIVAATASGDWAGKENWLARYVLEGQFWQFYEPGVQVQTVVNDEDGFLYVYDTGVSPQEWIPIPTAGAQAAPIITMPNAAYTLGELSPGFWHRFTNSSLVTITVELDATEPILEIAEFGIEAAGTLGVEIVPVTGVNIRPPKAGTLTLDPDDFLMLKRLDADEYKAIGESIQEDSP